MFASRSLERQTSSNGKTIAIDWFSKQIAELTNIFLYIFSREFIFANDV